jgi:FtsH-binding integral membrane protein
MLREIFYELGSILTSPAMAHICVALGLCVAVAGNSKRMPKPYVRTSIVSVTIFSALELASIPIAFTKSAELSFPFLSLLALSLAVTAVALFAGLSAFAKQQSGHPSWSRS